MEKKRMLEQLARDKEERFGKKFDPSTLQAKKEKSVIDDVEYYIKAIRTIYPNYNGDQAKLHYAIKDEEGNPLVDEDGVILQKPKEFAHMSNGAVSDLGGGIGIQWFEKYWKDLYPSDECVMDGKTYPVPTYYDKILKRYNRELYDEVKAKRQENSIYSSLSKPLEQSQYRLLQKETVKMAQITQLAREI